MDPSILVSTAGKALVEGTIRKMMKKSENIDETLGEDFKILGREMRVECPQSIQNYSVTFETKVSGLHLLPKKKKFNFGKVRRVTLRPIMSLQSIPDAISYVENGFEISLNKLERDIIYLLDIEYFIDDKKFIDSLVNRNVARESLDDETTEYWLVAQLKHLDVLKQNFGYIELKDLDFSVDVSVYNEIKMKVPSVFKKQLDIAVKILSKHHGGRGEQFKLLAQLRQLQHAQKEKYYGEIFDIIDEIQEIFSPYTFSSFVDVKKDFQYYDCERGKDFYETLPFPTWPKSMKVISRTDVNFNRPAVDGMLIFKKKDFLKEIGKIFGKGD
ncbi:hypothetical protein FHEFKHOI_00141 [Candidatus Methanoperedenaceae archaeon GB50]|nr:hypothetical protein AIOGIFDO_00143 [Candidatus Methanoperedenaceae archaeon GB37]CAD7768196.1 hypothetical protein FHEFKHOI_00141 [Candidatus Methanoperedenaceae archaeon GB50]CAD7779581.1 MAG: hypothetical protein KBONHNOK_01336 [Candidatus Methanoperedenaceae archaeon GB50]